MLKSWRKLKRKGLTKNGKPIAEKLFMRLDPQPFKFYGDKIGISVELRRFIWLKLDVDDYQRRFIEAWRKEELKAGEAIVNYEHALIPFRKQVNLIKPNDWIAIDVNEANITEVSTNSHVLRVETNLRKIHTTYFNIKRRIQKLAKAHALLLSENVSFIKAHNRAETRVY